jgi:hypothetical protein
MSVGRPRFRSGCEGGLRGGRRRLGLLGCDAHGLEAFGCPAFTLGTEVLPVRVTTAFNRLLI